MCLNQTSPACPCAGQAPENVPDRFGGSGCGMTRCGTPDAGCREPAGDPAPVQTAPIPFMPRSVPLAMAYVPMQVFDRTYRREEALHRGTLFPELDLPFCGKTIGGCRHG